MSEEEEQLGLRRAGAQGPLAEGGRGAAHSGPCPHLRGVSGPPRRWGRAGLRRRSRGEEGQRPRPQVCGGARFPALDGSRPFSLGRLVAVPQDGLLGELGTSVACS